MKQTKSKLTPCPVCGKMCRERGLKSHMRLLHQLKITEVSQVKKEKTQVVLRDTKVNTQEIITTRVIETKKTLESEKKRDWSADLERAAAFYSGGGKIPGSRW